MSLQRWRDRQRTAPAAGPGSNLWTGRAERGAPAIALALVVSLAAAGCGSSGTPAAKSSHVGTAPAASGPAGGVTGSGSAQQPAPIENNPPGDIPDNVAYVSYSNHAGGYSFLHPEGWASVEHGPTAMFTDKLNGITATGRSGNIAPTVSSAQQSIGQLKTSEAAFELRSIKAASLPGGTGVVIVFRRNSAPDPVTGKVFRDEVRRYLIYRSGRLVTLDLFGAVGSDNVDPYTKISESLRLS